MKTTLRRLINIETLQINRRSMSAIVLDPHMKKHADITDECITEMVAMLDGTESAAVASDSNFQYFVSILSYQNIKHRFVWLLERDKTYIGVITAYKDRRIK